MVNHQTLCAGNRHTQGCFAFMKLVLIGIVSFSLIAPAAAWPAWATSGPQPQTTAKTKEARKLFKQKCAKCHGSDGAGNTTYGQIVGATDLTNREWQKQVEDERILNSLTAVARCPLSTRSLRMNSLHRSRCTCVHSRNSHAATVPRQKTEKFLTRFPRVW